MGSCTRPAGDCRGRGRTGRWWQRLIWGRREGGWRVFMALAGKEWEVRLGYVGI